MSQAWDGAGTGLIVSERLVNCPPQLAPPLVRALFSEISTAAKVGGGLESDPHARLTALVCITAWYTVQTLQIDQHASLMPPERGCLDLTLLSLAVQLLAQQCLTARCTRMQDSGDYQFQRYLLVSRAYTDEAGAAAENEDAAAADGANGAAPSSGKSKRKKASLRSAAVLLLSMSAMHT